MITDYKFRVREKDFLKSEYTCLVVFLRDDKELKSQVEFLEIKLLAKIPKLLKKQLLNTKISEITYADNKENFGYAILRKVRIDEDFNNDYFRNYFAGLISDARLKEITSLQILLPDFKHYKNYFKSEEYFFQTFIEGLYLGSYQFDSYKSEPEKEKKLDVYLIGNVKNISLAISNAAALMEGVYFARNLSNEPAVTIYPNELAVRIRNKAKELGIRTKIFDEKEIKKRNMGGVIAVGKGSDNPPRFIILNYKSVRKPKTKIALVGKGVTFDSGGISIKPSQKMSEMKADMGGAAAVVGTMISAAKAKLPLEIIGIIPSVENMPSGKALKPGDIIKTSSGKSIEVEDTDAEGRIILADALEYAVSLKPDLIIDLATLTGAAVVALGEFPAGLFTKNDKLAIDIYNAGSITFERVWRLPLWNEYNQLIKSDVADVKNYGGRWGGAITAAKFLEKFVDKNIPWAHLDIAGPAIYHELNNYTKKYMTGFGVRLLFEFLISKAK
jgi:leucyl aminopeptidase